MKIANIKHHVSPRSGPDRELMAILPHLIGRTHGNGLAAGQNLNPVAQIQDQTDVMLDDHHTAADTVAHVQ